MICVRRSRTESISPESAVVVLLKLALKDYESPNFSMRIDICCSL